MSTYSRNASRQRGASMTGWLVVIALVIFFMKLGFVLGPIYLNHYKAMSVIKKVVANPQTVTQGPTELRGALQRYWDVEDIKHFYPDTIKVKKTSTGRAFDIDYEVREPLFREISVVVHFVQEVPLPGGAE